MRRLLPDPGPTSVERQLAEYRPWEGAPAERPFLAVNFATTLDGRAAIGGISGPIGSSADTAMLSGLRRRFDAVMIGAGTMRAERYGPLAASRGAQSERERAGVLPEPPMVIVSGGLDLPWDAPLFTEPGRVILFTTAPPDQRPPATAAQLRLVRHRGRIDLGAALAQLRRQEGVRALLCEGGPHLHAELQADGWVDEVFLTIAPKLAGGEAPSPLEGELPGVVEMELAWLLEDGGELFARYRRRSPRRRA